MKDNSIFSKDFEGATDEEKCEIFNQLLDLRESNIQFKDWPEECQEFYRRVSAYFQRKVR